MEYDTKIMNIIVFVQLNMLTWLNKTSLPVDYEASLAPMDTCQSLISANWRLPAPVNWDTNP